MSAATICNVEVLEAVRCYFCESERSLPFLSAEEDLTGKPGTFHFVRCQDCGLAYQNPRIPVEHIKAYYDDDYIAHRRKKDWGALTRIHEYVMDQLDRNKLALVRPYLPEAAADVLDVGCGVGTFLTRMQSATDARVTGVDFKDFSSELAPANIRFRCGLFYDQHLEAESFDLVTMWHYLEHDYDPLRTLREARRVMRDEATLVIEVPRLDSWSYRLYGDRWPGLQAPQHTALYDKSMLHQLVERAGFECIDYKPYGAFPAYFYLFAGAAFKLLKGRGLDLKKWGYLYVAGRLALSPLLLFEKRLNLAMQTIVCRKQRGLP